MENNKITIFNCFKIFILLAITAFLFIVICITIAEKFNLNTLDFFSPDIGEIMSVICVLIYLYKKFDITLISLLNVKKFFPKTLILMLLMFFSSYIVINLITTNMTNAFPITPQPEHDHKLSQLSILAGLLFLGSLTIAGPIMEEIFFRGIFLLKLKDNFNKIAALILSSFLFAILHSPGYQQISAFITGLLFGIVTLKTNGIFCSIIGHILFNSLTTIFAIVSYNVNNNIIKLSNGAFYFNNVINIISIAIFVATFFIILKMPLYKVKS